jgi:CRISPR-associated endonuclease/helicase Cas3
VNEVDFAAEFEALTGNRPFPWQQELYENWFSKGKFPGVCTLPTGLGKTAVVAIWLIALGAAAERVPRRLVYVVNRRTVVDQTTDEVEKIRDNLSKVTTWFDKLAISTLRGQFADNREWSADPSKPAVIAGTVDMVGSRLLFSGYGVGFKAKPLHAGFLGQDVLLVHDEAHLEPAFQELLIAIRKEQERCKEFGTFRVMELSATSRGTGEVFELTKEEKEPPRTIPEPPTEPIHHVWRRQKAKKTVCLHENKDEKKLADELAALALTHQGSGRAVLVFVRKVDDVEKVVKRLPKGFVQQLTGTLRGLERDRMADPRRESGCPIFARFLKAPKAGAPEAERWKSEPMAGTVYLVCTSAGEVGVNISADHLVCDLAPFDSMAQRFGRVNRFGDRDDTRIDVVYPKEFDEKDDYDSRLKKTLELLRLSNGSGSPASLSELHQKAMREGSGPGPMSTDRTEALREYILATYAPQPKTLPVSDILFDAWALTTIRGNLPGRPMVEPYLHGISEWEPPETHVSWREEVWELRLKFASEEERIRREPEERKRLGKFAAELLEDYPLKPHELLRDISSRVFDRLKKLNASTGTQVWIVSDDDTVEVTTLAEVIDAGKVGIERKTVLLPPAAGGLKGGMLTDNPEPANDVADELFDATGARRRVRVWDDDDDYEAKTEDMRLVRRIDLPAGDADEDGAGRSWHWCELPKDGDSDGSKANKKPVLWQVHTDDVTNHATDFVARLPLSDDLKRAVIVAARLHDLGKRRALFQRMLGNTDPNRLLAKSGKKSARIPETYRHEFGSLSDVQEEPDFQQLNEDLKGLVLHLIAAHHGRGRPHFPADEAFDPEPKGQKADELAAAVVQRFARLQRRYGRWGLAYLESLLRAADYAASAKPSRFVEDEA